MEIVPLIDAFAIHQDGKDKLTANWNAGAYDIKATTFSTGSYTLTIDETKSLSDYMEDLVDDTSPQLGGDLDGQSSYDLINMVDGTFSGTVTAEQLTSTDDITADISGGKIGWSANEYLTRVSATIETYTGGTKRTTLSNGGLDLTVHLDMQDQDIIGTGNIVPYGPGTELGLTGIPFLNLWLTGNLSDNTNTLTVANAKAAYDHISNDGTDHSLLGATAGTASVSLALIVDASKDIDLDGGDITAFDITVENALYSNNFIGIDDPDTVIVFTGDDAFYFQAGGVEMMRFEEAAKNDNIRINSGGLDIDVFIETADNSTFFRTDAANNKGYFGDGGITNYAEFSTTGSLVLAGSATLEVGTVQTYAESNVTTDRTFDADTVAVAELADIVGTLIVDLRAIGLVN